MAKKTVINTKSETNATLNSAEKATLVIPNTGRLEQAEVNKDGINIKQALGALKLVDIADVDLLLTFANGERIVIPNGALEAVSSTPPLALFNDQKIALPELLKYVGLTYQAKPGSLRLVSENIDANPPSDIDTSDREPTPVSPPPAPVVKVSPGTGVGKGLANGLGDVPETYNPLVTAQPSVYRVGKSQTSTNDGTSIGTPNVTSVLYTSPELKVTSPTVHAPSVGAYSATATPEQLTINASPEKQAYNEIITGTSGADTIGHNVLFNGNSSEAQWVKNLHTTLNNFSSVSEIKVSFNVPSEILGFNLVGSTGVEITRDSPFGSTWTITPTTDMLTKGLDIGIVYTAQGSGSAAKDFNGVITVTGKSGAFNFEVINNLNMTWRDALTKEDFQAYNSSGTPLMVLPQRGVGMTIYGDDPNHPELGSNDIIHAGSGNDIIIGGLGGDTIDGGRGNDTASYQTATTDIVAKLSNTASEDVSGEAIGDVYTSIENLTGSSNNDTLIGNETSSNILNGGGGNDTLIGMGGSDILIGGDGIDTASYKYSTSVTASLIDNKAETAEGTDTLIGIENLIGSPGNDLLEGNAGANILDGGAGNDTVTFANSSSYIVASLTDVATINARGIAITITGDAVGDVYKDALGNTTIENFTGSAFNDTLIADANINILNGAMGDDTLEGLGGADQLTGGTGNDTASYAHATSAVTADLSGLYYRNVGASLQVGDALGDTFTSIENITGSKFNDTLIGDLSNNIINAGDGNDVLEGLAGADTFIGGDGTDTVTYVNSTGSVNASLTNNLSGFSSTGDAFGDTFNSIENLTGSKFDDTLIGDSGVNIINGGEGNDILEGMSGADRLEGGSGSNTASYANYVSITNQGVIASLESNAAKMASTTSTSVIDDITYITGGSITFGTLTSDNVDIVNDAAGDVYLNIQNLIGSQYDDILTGNYTQTSNTIVDRSKIEGGAGNDTIYTALIGNVEIRGGTGNDTVIVTNYLDNKQDILDGGDGVDTFVYNGNVIVYNLDMGKDGLGTFSPNNIRSYELGSTLGGLGSFVTLQNFENITINNGGFGGTIIASNLDNIITVTNATQKTISYQHAISGVKVNLSTDLTDPNTTNVSGGSGNDRIVGFSNVNGSAFNDEITGDNTNNLLNGGAGADRIDGKGGNDTVSYSDSSSAVNVDLRITSAQSTNNNGHASEDTLINIEHITGSSFNDNLIANNDAVQNILSGGNGDDTLRGFANDILYGQNGNDTFNINLSSLPNLIWGEAGNDTIKVEGITTANAAGMFASLSGGRSFQNEVINVRDGATHTFNIDAGTIQNIVDAGVSSKLTILADRGDVISLTSSQYFDGNQSFNQLTQTNTNDTYVIYSGSPATSTSTAISVVWA